MAVEALSLQLHGLNKTDHRKFFLTFHLIEIRFILELLSNSKPLVFGGLGSLKSLLATMEITLLNTKAKN